jgi:hypothetical protein
VNAQSLAPDVSRKRLTVLIAALAVVLIVGSVGRAITHRLYWGSNTEVELPDDPDAAAIIRAGWRIALGSNGEVFEMSFEGDRIDESVFLRAAKWRAVERVWIDGCPGFRGRTLDSLQECPLVFLSCYGSGVDDAAMHRIATLRTLEQLVLRGTSISDEGVAELRVLWQLTDLDLSDTAITNRALAPLKDLKRLYRLDLSGTHINDDGSDDLVGLKRVADLNLAETDVTDRCLSSLASMRSLRHLSLRGTLVSAKEWTTLTRFTQLESLDLRQTSFTASDAERLAVELPRAQILAGDYENGTAVFIEPEFPGSVP